MADVAKVTGTGAKRTIAAVSAIRSVLDALKSDAELGKLCTEAVGCGAQRIIG